MSNGENITRRPLKSRDTKWAGAVASWLARAGIRPNVISVAGTFFAAGAGVCFWFAGHTVQDWRWSVLLMLAVCGMQLRLLCNLFDGMVAIEGGFKTKAGEIFNELPDRFSDAFIFIGAAYSVPEFAWTHELGWAAAVLAVITAYVRALGGEHGRGTAIHWADGETTTHGGDDGRMCGRCIRADLAFAGKYVFPWRSTLVAAGCVITIIRRCRRIAQEMELKK